MEVEAEGKRGRGKRVGSRLERAARGQVATRNQGTSEPPSSHARNLQLPAKRYTHAVGADGRQASEPINTPSKNAPARTPCTRVQHDSSTCTRFFHGRSGGRIDQHSLFKRFSPRRPSLPPTFTEQRFPHFLPLHERVSSNLFF